MQWAFYRIPVNGESEAEELNRFLRTVRVLNCHREFVGQGNTSYWALAVEYLPGEAGSRGKRETGGAEKVDFKTVLSPDDFALFARLREWRKLVGTSEAVPVYTIFTNDQLAEIARRRPSSHAALGDIEGIGAGRVEKYGEAVLGVVRGFSLGEG
jgi:superfamily II DNA helicase RecQ